jgi:hypothetical protein
MVRAAGVTPDEATRLQGVFESKARAELKAADAVLGRVAVSGSGDPLGSIVLVKGVPDDRERAARHALAGPDGVAAVKALEALGLDPRAVWAFCSRPSVADPAARARRVELVIEAVDPRLVIALDTEAAEDIAAAFRLAALVPGTPISVRGRTLGSVGGLAASLANKADKAAVWARFKTIARAADAGTPAEK